MSENIGDILAKAMNRFLGKQGAEKEKKTVRDGEETLKKTLNKMYEQYKNSVSPKPNYDEKYGAETMEKIELPNYHADDALRKDAEAEAVDSYREKRTEAERLKEETADAYAAKKQTAAESYRDSLKSAEIRAVKARADAEAKIAAQGLGNSTVAEGLRMQAEQYAEKNFGSAEETYKNAIGAADLKIRAAEEKLSGALKTFDIAEAAKAEKELKKLQKDREVTLKNYASEYDSAIKKAEKAKKAKYANIEKDEIARDETFRKSVEESAGIPYEGEESAEMENRYRVAEAFYTSIPKDKAKSLIVNSAEELKFLLGNYYGRLLTTLKIN